MVVAALNGLRYLGGTRGEPGFAAPSRLHAAALG